jgi:hypothetical protein
MVLQSLFLEQKTGFNDFVKRLISRCIGVTRDGVKRPSIVFTRDIWPIFLFKIVLPICRLRHALCYLHNEYLGRSFIYYIYGLRLYENKYDK